MLIPPEDIAAKWAEMAPLIDRLQAESAEPGMFDVMEGSTLADDDSDRGGYPTSHAATWCATTAIDHLHAVKMLVVDAGVHHLFATSTLARGTIEAAATGLWMLTPSDKAVRDERCIQWWCQNAKDQHKAKPDEARRDEILSQLTYGVPHANRIRKGYYMTAVVEWVDEHVGPVEGAAFAWKLSSGFAHGRPWAVIGAQNREARTDTGSGTTMFKMTARDETVLWPALVGTHATLALIRRFRTLAGTLEATAYD